MYQSLATDTRTGEKGKLWIRGRAWLDAYVARELRKQLPADADPMLAGSGSPALERYRQARAEREELNLAEHRGELIHTNKIKQDLMAAMSVIREATNQLQREFGTKAREILAEALDEAQAKLEAIGRGSGDSEHSGDGATDEVGAAASVAAGSPVDA